MKPTLTYARWRALKRLGRRLGHEKPFTGAQFDIKGQTLASLEECGWVARVEAPAPDTPFALPTQGHHWIVTPAGREAIAALPDQAPRRT
jgi:hypothetical protein